MEINLISFRLRISTALNIFMGSFVILFLLFCMFLQGRVQSGIMLIITLILAMGLAVLGYLLVEYAVYNGVYIKGQYLAAFLYIWKYMAAWAVLYLEYEILVTEHPGHGVELVRKACLQGGGQHLVRMIVTGKPEIMMFTGDIIFWFVSFVLYVIVWWNEDEISTN